MLCKLIPNDDIPLRLGAKVVPPAPLPVVESKAVRWVSEAPSAVQQSDIRGGIKSGVLADPDERRFSIEGLKCETPADIIRREGFGSIEGVSFVESSLGYARELQMLRQAKDREAYFRGKPGAAMTAATAAEIMLQQMRDVRATLGDDAYRDYRIPGCGCSLCRANA